SLLRLPPKRLALLVPPDDLPETAQERPQAPRAGLHPGRIARLRIHIGLLHSVSSREVRMRIQRLLVVLVVIGLLTSIPASAQTPAPQCAKAKHIVYANVVAFDQLIMLNRRGASIPEGMIFALASDVVGLDGKSAPSKGNAMLRPGKRARPIVLRVNQYDCLAITFTNLLNSTPVNNAPPPPSKTLQTATRNASIHINGMQLWEKIS